MHLVLALLSVTEYSRDMDNKERQRKFKEKRKAQGLKRYEYWLTPAAKQAVDELLKQLEE